MTSARVVVVRDIGNAHDASRRSGSRRGSPIRSTACTWCSSRAAAASRRARQGVQGERRRSSGPAAEQTADVLQRELQRRAPEARARRRRRRSPRTSATTRAASPSSSSCCTRPTATTRRSTLDEVEQYLGELGTAGRFDLTNAIDRGDVGSALETLHRMLTASSAAQPKPLHPMQVMASLVFHYQRLLRLDDPSIITKEHAAEALGMKSAGGARFPLEAAKRLGSDGLRDAIGLLAQAELDLRGAGGLDERTVIDVLVARLAALEPAARARRSSRGPSPRSGRLRRRTWRARFMRREVRRAAAFLWMTPLARGLVDALLRGLHELGRTRRRRRSTACDRDLHARLQLGADALVADAALLVLTVALLLRLDVGHAKGLRTCS